MEDSPSHSLASFQIPARTVSPTSRNPFRIVFATNTNPKRTDTIVTRPYICFPIRMNPLLLSLQSSAFESEASFFTHSISFLKGFGFVEVLRGSILSLSVRQEETTNFPELLLPNKKGLCTTCDMQTNLACAFTILRLTF